MRDFSFGDAISAGFKLIGRNPLAVLMWGVANFVLTQLASIVMMLFTGGNLYQVMQRAAVAGPNGAPDMAAMLRAEQPFLMLFPIQLLLFLVYYSVVNAAVFRAVLEPENKRSFYMRLGSQELIQGLVVICQFVFSLLVMVALVALGVAAVVALGGSNDIGTKFLVGFLGWIVGLVCYVWLWLRFCLAPPMSFSQKSFRLFESWSMTRGHVWKLFGVGCVLFVLLFAAGIVFEVVIGSVMIGMVGMNGFTPQSMAAGGPFANMQAMMPVWIVVGVVMSLLGGFVHAIVWAPWAEAYRQIVGPNDVARTAAAFE